MAKSLMIICERCNKPVDSITLFDDLITDSKVIIAKCHGKEDVMTIPFNSLTFEIFEALESTYGVAFKNTSALIEKKESQ